MAIFILLDIYCTVRLFSIFIWSPPELSLIPSLSPSPLANQHRVLLLDNLDDVFVLHDMRQADPLGAVLGTGSLEDKKVSRYQTLPSCMYLRRTTKLDSQTRLNYKTLFSLIIKKHQECVVSFKHTTGRWKKVISPWQFWRASNKGHNFKIHIRINLQLLMLLVQYEQKVIPL